MHETFMPYEEARRRLDAMARLFTKSDTVISGAKIRVTVTDNPPFQAPSWTDGETITFNKQMIGDVRSVDDIIRVLGLNHHELAHCLYTPRQGSPVTDHVLYNGLGQAFNILEDQRIETFLTATYPSAIPYLISAFLRFCIQTDSAWESNFALMYGRRFLPKEVRQEFRNRFSRKDLIPQFEAIIDEYRKLIFPADNDRACELIDDFQVLLNDMAGTGQFPQDPNGHMIGRGNVTEGTPVSQKDQNDAAAASDAFDQAFDADDDDDDDADSGDGDGGGDSDSDGKDHDGDDTNDSDAGDSGGKGDTDPDASPHDGDAGDASDDKSNQQQPNGQSTGAGGGVDRTDDDGPANQPRSDSDLRELLDDMCKAFEDLDEVKDEISDAQNAIVNGDGDISTGVDQGRYRELDVQPDDVQAARMFARQLERLRAEADPGWNARQSSGRLNVKRFMDGDPVETLFDRWDEGHSDVADIECVVLVDTSGSMRPQIGTASRAMWTIKRALETLEANVSVFSYDSSTSLVYDSHETVARNTYRSLNVAGWTKPLTAIEEGMHILSSTERSNRIFIVITDGRWDSVAPTPDHPYSPDELIAEMNKREITTALAHIDRSAYNYIDDHGCAVAARINSAGDLVDFAKRIVTQTMKFSAVK